MHFGSSRESPPLPRIFPERPNHESDHSSRSRRVERHSRNGNRNGNRRSSINCSSAMLRTWCNCMVTSRNTRGAESYMFTLNLSLPTGTLHATGEGADVLASVKMAFAEISSPGARNIKPSCAKITNGSASARAPGSRPEPCGLARTQEALATRIVPRIVPGCGASQLPIQSLVSTAGA